MKIVPLRPEDGEKTLRLFCEAVRSVCGGEYSPRQIEAWIGDRDPKQWTDSFFGGRLALAAWEGEEIVGFADMTEEGYFDRLYVHPSFLHRGIASALADALEAWCPAPRFTVYASETARGFFAARGYRLLCRHAVLRGRETLVNYHMDKEK